MGIPNLPAFERFKQEIEDVDTNEDLMDQFMFIIEKVLDKRMEFATEDDFIEYDDVGISLKKVIHLKANSHIREAFEKQMMEKHLLVTNP